MNEKQKYFITTFGCKVNQVDSAWMAEQLEPDYIRAESAEYAGLIIVNGCTVTGRATAEARRTIARLRRENPEARLVISGCIAESCAGDSDYSESDIIIANAEKGRFRSLVDPEADCSDGEENWLSPSGAVDGDKTRAFLTVQNGCDSYCSYCIVPSVRGKPRSMPVEDVLARARRLADAGKRELVLCGIHLGHYGRELPGVDLSNLVEKLLDLGIFDRIRLSSLEAREIDEKLLGLFESSDALCRHFHLTLQSGDDRILKLMNRKYTAEEFLSSVNRLTERLGRFGLGYDVIVGFPGEDEAAFENSYRLIERSPISYLHVFPFSQREGVAAADMTQNNSDSEISRRAQVLRALAQQKKSRYEHDAIGTKSRVLFENYSNGVARGRSDDYLIVTVDTDSNIENRIGMVEITELKDDRLCGELCSLDGEPIR